MIIAIEEVYDTMLNIFKFFTNGQLVITIVEDYNSICSCLCQQ